MSLVGLETAPSGRRATFACLEDDPTDSTDGETGQEHANVTQGKIDRHNSTGRNIRMPIGAPGSPTEWHEQLLAGDLLHGGADPLERGLDAGGQLGVVSLGAADDRGEERGAEGELRQDPASR